MHALHVRSKDLLPSILLTLTSIIQALALEVLWSNVTSKAHLWDFTHAAVISWLQVMVVFQSIVLVWLFYAHLVLRFRWVPEIRDSVVPFLFGLGEFTLAEMLSPEHLHVTASQT